MVFLFTGYMISNSRKKENHFPPEKEQEIKEAINAILSKYEAGPDDLAVTTGMDAGSEILFVESCAERGVPVQAYFPLFESAYVRDFVSPGGEGWVERFYKMRNHPLVDEFYQPECVGLPKEGDNVHERNNRWALYSALARGIDKVRLIAVWDGKGEFQRPGCTLGETHGGPHARHWRHDRAYQPCQIIPHIQDRDCAGC